MELGAGKPSRNQRGKLYPPIVNVSTIAEVLPTQSPRNGRATYGKRGTCRGATIPRSENHKRLHRRSKNKISIEFTSLTEEIKKVVKDNNSKFSLL